MIKDISRLAAAAAAALVSAALFGDVAQAGDSQDRDGRDGKSGTSTSECRWTPPTEDGLIQCTARPGSPGPGGSAVEY